MKKLILGAAVLLFFIAPAYFLYDQLFGYEPLPNATRIMNIAWGYENFWVDQADSFEFQSREDLISKLEGNNARDIKYMDSMEDNRDTWGRPLEIRPLEGKKIEIRSAGRDGRLYTEDDWVEVSPREKKGGK